MQRRILLGTTGNIGAKDTIQLVELLALTYDVQVVASTPSLAFFDLATARRMTDVHTDDDDWYTWRQRGDQILHITLRNWADLFVIAPLTANTLGKLVSGICDNLLTTTYRAWQVKSKPLLVAPSMNKYMWEHPLTEKQLELLKSWDVGVIPPREKWLAGGDFGPAAMATPEQIVESVESTLSIHKAP
ncbi:flavoprotein [Pandoraea commovens]|uniref:Coenzyme A biosynthesis bifunctional protein CoaBC n=1 Tax=Pandoraea commovens TaxID=2508289 RepID=A0A5E4TMI3_9BURK|nr:flavoprotein [Pandoraea commovens]VVD87794.1 Coenzyme A biosynthesis bifunctional protein CoaBC [Pandoraea commovens]